MHNHDLLRSIHHGETAAVSTGEGEQHGRGDEDKVIVDVHRAGAATRTVVPHHHQRNKRQTQDDQDIQPAGVGLETTGKHCIFTVKPFT